MRVRKTIVVLPLLIMVAGGCTSGGGGENVATAGGRSPGRTSGPSTDPVAREAQFVECMRKAGIDMPDPVPGDTSGRSSLLQAMDKGMALKDTFQTALDGCTSFLPPAEKPSPATAADVEKRREYAKCMRDNGVKDFPDPDPVTGELNGWLLAGDKTAEAASAKCQSLNPPPSPSGTG